MRQFQIMSLVPQRQIGPFFENFGQLVVASRLGSYSMANIFYLGPGSDPCHLVNQIIPSTDSHYICQIRFQFQYVLLCLSLSTITSLDQSQTGVHCGQGGTHARTLAVRTAAIDRMPCKKYFLGKFILNKLFRNSWMLCAM